MDYESYYEQLTLLNHCPDAEVIAIASVYTNVAGKSADECYAYLVTMMRRDLIRYYNKSGK